MTFLAKSRGIGTHRASFRWPKPRMRSSAARESQRRVPTHTGTREMPKFPVEEKREPPAAGTAHVARTERNAGKKTESDMTPHATYDRHGPSEGAREQVDRRCGAPGSMGPKMVRIGGNSSRAWRIGPLTDVRRISRQ